MNGDLETRLRRDLSSVDDTAVRSLGAVHSAADAAARRLRNRRRATVAAGAAVVVTALVVTAVVATRDSAPDRIASAPISPDVTAPSAAHTDDSAASAPDSTAAPDSAAPAPTTTEVPATAWEPIPPDPRGPAFSPTVVWTGTEAFVLGGNPPLGNERVSGAAAFDPDTSTWRTLSDPPQPQPADPLSEWTGSEWIVLGGHTADVELSDGTTYLPYGTRYDPGSDSWRPMAGQPSYDIDAATPHAWTGTELLVWPAGDALDRGLPVAYGPSSDTWRDLPAPPVEARRGAASVWTGEEWIVWGGRTLDGRDLGDGAAYSPATGTWRVLADSPLSARTVNAVWTGDEMIVQAGYRGGDATTGNGALALDSGAAYDPATDTWRTLTSGPAHPGFVPIWTGRYVVHFAKGSAVAYDVTTDTWLHDDEGDGDQDPGPRAFGATPVWTGEVILALGSDSAERGGVIIDPTFL